jgi:hypothetical protein
MTTMIEDLLDGAFHLGTGYASEPINWCQLQPRGRTVIMVRKLILPMSGLCFALFVVSLEAYLYWCRHAKPIPDPPDYETCSLDEVADYLEGSGLQFNTMIGPGDQTVPPTMIIDRNHKYLNSLQVMQAIESHNAMRDTICVYQYPTAKAAQEAYGAEHASFVLGRFVFRGDAQYLLEVRDHLETMSHP